MCPTCAVHAVHRFVFTRRPVQRQFPLAAVAIQGAAEQRVRLVGDIVADEAGSGDVGRVAVGQRRRVHSVDVLGAGDAQQVAPGYVGGV